MDGQDKHVRRQKVNAKTKNKSDNKAAKSSAKSAKKTPHKSITLSMKRAGTGAPRNRVYTKVQEAIYRQVNKLISRRKVKVSATEVFENIHISSPAFYGHHDSIESAYKDQERVLQNEFADAYAKFKQSHNGVKTPNQQFFLQLLLFIYQHREYFKAAFDGHDSYVLTTLLESIRADLVGDDKQVLERVYAYYILQLCAIITIWGIYDDFDTNKLEHYATKLAYVRLVDVGR